MEGAVLGWWEGGVGAAPGTSAGSRGPGSSPEHPPPRHHGDHGPDPATLGAKPQRLRARRVSLLVFLHPGKAGNLF